MPKCDFCGQEKDVRGFANHVLFCAKNPNKKVIERKVVDAPKPELEKVVEKAKEIIKEPEKELIEEPEEEEEEPEPLEPTNWLEVGCIVVSGIVLIAFVFFFLIRGGKDE